MRTRLARMLRNIAMWPRLPLGLGRAAQRAAFAIRPHSLTCRSCGARFVQPSYGSLMHASRAYQHYIDSHEAERVADERYADWPDPGAGHEPPFCTCRGEHGCGCRCHYSAEREPES